MLACWGAFLGLIPPVFLTDEIEGLDPKDMLYAGAIGIVGLVVPIITVPTATGTVDQGVVRPGRSTSIATTSARTGRRSSRLRPGSPTTSTSEG